MKLTVPPRFFHCIMLLLMAGLTHAQQPQPFASASQLKQQIQKLEEAACDDTAPPELKEFNRRVLSERQTQLYNLLQNKKDALHKYLSAVGLSLTPQEARVIEGWIQDVETEMENLRDNAPHRTVSENAAPTATTRIADVAPAPVAPSSISVTNSISLDEPHASAASQVSVRRKSPHASAVVNAAAATVDDADIKLNLNDWLNKRIDEKVGALIDQGSNANQVESPSLSDSSTSLVDQTSAPDLFGTAFNLIGLFGSPNDMEASPLSITTTPYALYAAFKGAEPLDPAFYNRHRNLRRLSFTLGYEREKSVGSDALDRTTLAGFKFLIINGRDASKHLRERHAVSERLKQAAGGFAQINLDVKKYLFKNQEVRSAFIRDSFKAFLIEKRQSLDEQLAAFNGTAAERRDLIAERQSVVELMSKNLTDLFDFSNEKNWTLAEREFWANEFQNKQLNSTNYPLVLAALTPEAREELDALIDARINPFVELRTTARAQLERIRRAPQFSFAFSSKNRRRGDDEYMTEAIFDYGILNRLNLTLNGGFNRINSRSPRGSHSGGTFAGQLQFQLTPENHLINSGLFGGGPIKFALAADGKWLTGLGPMYRAQTKVTIPLFNGVELPVSLTYANRTELLKESDVRGQFGFTFDVAKLIAPFVFKVVEK